MVFRPATVSVNFPGVIWSGGRRVIELSNTFILP